MCGICGIITSNPERYRSHVTNMLKSLEHRGPDGEGTYEFSNGIFGHRRLSIVDLDTGLQPMISPDNNLAVTFNGEIYGYQSIKSKIDYSYQTSSDTEVILALYNQFGQDMMSHLPGMFAFSIWDESNKMLFCARDRSGEKPFFFALTPRNEFVFASEIKAILASGLIDPEIDEMQVSHYLKHLYVHPHHSIYKNIHVLPPAHQLIFSDGALKISRYWNVNVSEGNITMDEAAEEFELLLRNSIQKQLIADVPVGAFLSGGLDSGTIVSMAAGRGMNLNTFCLAFEQGNNEFELAEAIAEKYQTKHFIKTDTDHDLAELVVNMAKVYDEPFADSSCIPTYILSEFAAKQNKVVLTGDGGDELLGGYSFWYQKLLQSPDFSGYSRGRTLALSFIEAFLLNNRNINERFGREIEGLKNWKRGSVYFDAHKKSNIYYSDDELLSFGLPCVDHDLYFPERYTLNSINSALLMDFESYLPGDLLVKTDRASMAHGLELRSPFLDKDLIEFCFSLPAKLKIDSKEGKKVLRNVSKKLLTPRHFDHPKTGFGGPVKNWMRQPGFQVLLDEYLSNKNSISQFIKRDSLEKFKDDLDYKLWAALVLSIWLEN